MPCFLYLGMPSRENQMRKKNAIRKLVRAAKHALERPEFSTPRADGIEWRRAPVWDNSEAVRPSSFHHRQG